MVSGLNIEHTFGIRATEKWLSANKLDGFVLQIQPWPVIGLLAPHRSTLRRRQQVIDASWPLERHASGHPAAGEPFNKWWNNKNRKSYFLTKAFYLKKKQKSGVVEMDEALKWRRWSMTAIERTTSLTNVPITPACVVELDRPPDTLSLALFAEDGCVCVWPMTE